MSSTHAVLTKKNSGLRAIKAIWRIWLKEDAPVVGYMLKVLLSCLLAMWLSLKFELDQPRTAMLTVAIVMQSRSGMVFAKSYYRLLGTLVGILVSFLLVALFAQERVLFLFYMALWIGLCTAGSMIYRNHQSYAFVLAGYTLCIVGLPATIRPELTFNIGVTRISEILIGLLCATLVSDLIFPQRVWDLMLVTVRRRFSDFSDLLRTHAQSSTIPSETKKELLRFVTDIYSLESFRASAVLEVDASRRHRLRLNLMNNEFMEVATTFHALDQLLRRQRKKGHQDTNKTLINLYQHLGNAITLNEKSAKTEQEAVEVSGKLKLFRDSFQSKCTLARQQLPLVLSNTEQLNFETGAELVLRLAEELFAYARTYASMSSKELRDQDNSSIAPQKTQMYFDPLTAILAGIRGTLTLAVMAALWILTDWRSGIEAITIGVITSTLFATSPSPSKAILQFMTGAVIGTLLAYICNFQWLTEAQGFWMLAMAVTPGILIGTWFTTRPTMTVVGSGIFIVFLLHIGFNSTYSANPVTFVNDALADLLAVLVSGLMYELIDISSSLWSRKRIARALCELITKVSRNNHHMRRSQLEVAARSLVQRNVNHKHIAEENDRPLIDWLLYTLEIGHAVIALRERLSEITLPLMISRLNKSLESIAVLHADPSKKNRAIAVMVIDESIATLTTEPTRFEVSPAVRHKLLTMLYFIYSALLDEDSVLTSFESFQNAT